MAIGVSMYLSGEHKAGGGVFVELKYKLTHAHPSGDLFIMN
jgi:hypothetical protein